MILSQINIVWLIKVFVSVLIMVSSIRNKSIVGTDEINSESIILVVLNWSSYCFFACQTDVRYTASSELLPLLAAGRLPLLKVDKITQTIDTSSSTIINSTTLSSPFASLSFSASASFEVRTPTRIQVLWWKPSYFTKTVF